MLRSDLSDIHSLQDSDVETLIKQLKVVVKKHGVSLTMRIVAFVLGAFRRENFIKAHEVKEASSPNILRVPSVLVNKEPTERNAPARLDHASLWKKEGRLHFLMSEPYYISKADLKTLIAHCDEYGIDFQVDAESFYYPGHCIRILFKKGSVTPGDATNHEYADIDDKREDE